MQYKKTKLQADDLNKKRKFLIKLIAGTKNLETFLAMLNKNALQNNVKVLEFVPKKILNYKNPKINKNDDLIANNKKNISNRIPSPSISTEPILNDKNNTNINEKEFLIIPEIENIDSNF